MINSDGLATTEARGRRHMAPQDAVTYTNGAGFCDIRAQRAADHGLAGGLRGRWPSCLAIGTVPRSLAGARSFVRLLMTVGAADCMFTTGRIEYMKTALVGEDIMVFAERCQVSS